MSCAAVSQRLPGGAVPDHYSLTFAINFPSNSFEGDETIDLHLTKPGNSITLNALEIDFHEVTVTAAGLTQTAKVSLDDKSEMATFTVGKPLPEGPANVHIKYTGHLNNKMRGLYQSTSNGRKYAVTQMEPTDARIAFPNFDEPAYKATFDITVIVDKGDTAISNGEVLSDQPGPGAQHTIKFATSPKMSSYLVALTVGDWKCAHDQVDGIKLGVCTVPGKEQLTPFAMAATKAILHYYNDYYGIKYPLPKLDEIAAPDFNGAMENWGAIIYRESALLLDEKAASLVSKKGVTRVIAHEVAHQWFGDLVTAAWWDDIWLNEGFATWMTPHPIEAWKPDWLVSQDVVDDTSDALTTDGIQNTRPIHQQAEIRGEIDSLFDGIAYGKTGAVLHMLESYLGAETFRAGVNLYLKEHAYGNATAADFWSAMARSSKKPVDEIMPTFVMQAGEPYVGVTTSCEGGNTKLVFSQKRYFNTPAAFQAPNEQKWQVPVCARGIEDARGQNLCFLLTEKQQQFNLKGCPKFVFPNAGALGYYRYDYDSRTLPALGKAAEQKLSPEERISLVRNEWALVRSGQHGVGEYLALGDQFKNTPGYILLESFFAQLEFVNDKLADPADRPAFHAWLRQSFSPLLQQLGYAGRPDDTPEQKLKRGVLFLGLGNVADDPEVIAQANVLVQQYMKDPASVDGTLARAVVWVAARHGNADLYAQYRAQLQKQLSPEVYYRFFYNLAEFPDPALARQTVAWSLTPEVRSQDLYILQRIAGNTQTQEVGWDFIRQHYDEISKKSGGGVGGMYIFIGTAEGFCDARKRDEVERFFQQHPMPGTEQKQREAIESITNCIALRDQQQAKLSAWLKHNEAGGTTATGASASTATH